MLTLAEYAIDTPDLGLERIQLELSDICPENYALAFAIESRLYLVFPAQPVKCILEAQNQGKIHGISIHCVNSRD